MDWRVIEWIYLGFRVVVVLHHQHDLRGLRVDLAPHDVGAAALRGCDRAGNVLLAKVAWRSLTCHGAPRRLRCLLAVRPLRSALTGSRRSCVATSAVWNARSRMDRFVTRARGGKPLGASGLIDIHIAI